MRRTACPPRQESCTDYPKGYPFTGHWIVHLGRQRDRHIFGLHAFSAKGRNSLTNRRPSACERLPKRQPSNNMSDNAMGNTTSWPPPLTVILACDLETRWRNCRAQRTGQRVQIHFQLAAI